jgi:peptidoglycan/LPS O-acetylase OafA/YrhL
MQPTLHKAKVPRLFFMTKDKRISELDILRGAAIFGVLVIHSSFEGHFTEETMALQAIMSRLFDWAVLAFFFSSGFMHDISASFAVTLKKRTLSLLVPFFLYNVFYNLCFFWVEAMGWSHVGGSDTNSKSIGGFFLWSPAFQLYFLPYLFMISIGVSGMEKLIQRRYKWGYFAIFFLVMIFYLDHGYPEASHGADFRNLPMYLAMFMIGVISRPFIKEPFSNPLLIVVVLVAVLGILVFSRFCEASLLVPPLLTAMAGAISTIRQSKLFLCLGNMSGSIYVWHTPLILPAISRLLAYGGVPSLLNLFGSIVLTLAICILLRLGLDAMFVKMTKKNSPKYITL